MPLLTINDPEELLAEAPEGPLGLPLVRLPGAGFNSSLLKFGEYGCCEVLGYQLAPRLKVPVMPAVPVWCPHAFPQMSQMVGEGRIGLAIRYDEAFRHITMAQAATQAPEIVAASLILDLLCRDEWVEFGVTESGLVVYDLEKLFPHFCPERVDGQTWDDVAREERYFIDTYRSLTTSLVQHVLDAAAELALTELFQLAVANAVTISVVELRNLFDLEPHPRSEQIQGIATDVAVMRFKHAASLLSV